ncbi:helix-turn-helix transcriptional regulator [Paraburkholderia sp. RL17-347-BIC-D]|uniref:helix-turn-helix transcriptional regulator n=1 Tax=Paraburkholderia sp. RL17-347-BIC-D TaxID=3031632 RepID=UPI0038B81391
MSEPLRIIHGPFGRVALLMLDKSMVLHAHRVSHVIFKEGGPDIQFGIRNREHVLSDRNVLLVNAWEPHFYEHRPQSEPTVLLALYLEPDWLREVDRRFAYSIHPRFFSRPSVALQGKLGRLHTDLLDILTDREGQSLQALQGLIADMTGELVGVLPQRNELSAAGSVGGIAYDIRIRRAIEAMKEVRGIAPDFDDLAQTVGLSRPHFFHLFRKQTGMTPATFGSMLRMDLSIQSVSQQEMALQDVALNLGFDSPGNFTRFFARQQGVTPSQYRHNVQFVSGAAR